MVKNKHSRDAEGALKKNNKPNPCMKEKQRHLDLQKLQIFNNNKTEEQQAKDMMAVQAALEMMGMQVCSVALKSKHKTVLKQGTVLNAARIMAEFEMKRVLAGPKRFFIRAT